MPLNVRDAIPDDVAAIAGIYNEGIEDRVATFETRLRTPEDIVAWFDGAHPAVHHQWYGEHEETRYHKSADTERACAHVGGQKLDFWWNNVRKLGDR